MSPTLTLHPGDRDGPFDEMLGRAVGSYRIVRLLGRGGMGAVYLARHPGIGSVVALKFLHARFGNDRGVIERFFNEARAVNLIGHENILKILDFSSTPDGRYFFVMEYLRGQPLTALTGKPVPLAVAGPIFLQCCKALQAAHDRQIVHRDLKPDNIFLLTQMGRKNFVKLVDFGIAKLVDQAGAGQTEAGALIGTPEYMSPEQAAGRSGEIGRRSDVYSLGVVMYQLATGRLPFSGPTTAETLVAQMSAPPPPPRSIEPAIPEAYEAILLRCLAKKKDDRFASMSELHDALSGCMRGLGLSTELPVADEPPPALPEEAAHDSGEPGQSGPQTGASDTPPLTQTFSGDRAPLQARIDRLGDKLLAPSRRWITLGLLGAVVLVLVLATRPAPQAPRGTAPQPGSAATAPAAHAPTGSGAAPAAHQGQGAAPAHQGQGAAPAAPTGQGAAPATHQGQSAASPAQHGGAASQAPHNGPAAHPAVAQPPGQHAAPSAQRTPEQAQRGSTKGAHAATPAHPAAPQAPSMATNEALPPPLTAAASAQAAALAARASSRPGAADPGSPGAARPQNKPAPASATAPDPVAKALAEMQGAAAQSIAAEAALPKPPGWAKLFVVTNPLGATVTAAWSGKSATGAAPFTFKVRRGASVVVTCALPGYAPAVQEVPATASQVVLLELKKATP